MKNWNLKYVAGNPDIFSKVTANASNPLKRSEALKGAEEIADNGWRVWVEHKDTGERIFESDVEKKYKDKFKPEDGDWVHCSPELLSSGVSCADTPRRACACEKSGSHDHWIPHNH